MSREEELAALVVGISYGDGIPVGEALLRVAREWKQLKARLADEQNYFLGFDLPLEIDPKSFIRNPQFDAVEEASTVAQAREWLEALVPLMDYDTPQKRLEIVLSNLRYIAGYYDMAGSSEFRDRVIPLFNAAAGQMSQSGDLQ